MTTIAKENLDERIERIKKRNEEIEKKYREAEEDRLMALKDNAMVEIKPKIDYDDKDWPKAHKYDKIDFTYDVKPEKLLELEKQKQQQQENLKNLKRNGDYKKFPDGEGPPPDPAYNFLADAERDGIISSLNRKDSRQNNVNNNGGVGGGNNKNKDHYHQQHKRGAPNNNSFRGGGVNKNNKTQKSQNKNSQPEYEQWRNEREKIDEARINRQKIGDGKWKREWDNDKLNTENDRSEKITLGDAYNNSAVAHKKSPVHNGHSHSGVGGGGQGIKVNRQNSGHNFMNTVDCLVEKRGNITVSVSQTGEVKSVKLTSAPAIGTGRVGPRQISKPQFSIQTVPVEREVTLQQQVPLSPHFQHKNLAKNNHNSSSPPQKVPNKSSNNSNATVNGNAFSNLAITSSPSVNPGGKTKKDNKKHPPKQSSESQHQQQQIQIVPQQKPQRKNFQVGGVGDKTLPVVSTPIVPPDTTNALSTQSAVASLPSSANEIPTAPIVDLSHKPEFQKRSIQDRLLRVRQSNSNSSQSNAPPGAAATKTSATSTPNPTKSDNNINNASAAVLTLNPTDLSTTDATTAVPAITPSTTEIPPLEMATEVKTVISSSDSANDTDNN